MEFWGVEVKAGQPLKVKPSFDNIIHLSQASLGETKKEKGHDSAPVFVKFGDNKLVLGTLIPEKIPQLSFDLVFEKEFELSHNWKSGSIYFCGYQTPLPYDDDSEGFDMDESEEEEELTPIPAANGKGGPKVENAKAAAKAVAAKLVAAAKPNKDIKPKEDEEDDSDDSMDDGFGDDDSLEMSDEEGGSDEDDDDDADDSDEEEDSDEDVTPKKVEVGKKRPGVSATKTPVSAKKAKAGTPQSDGKKGGHVATPHPKKQGGKTPVNNKSPNSGGQHSGKSHSKSFTSNGARGSHTKAKHSGK